MKALWKEEQPRTSLSSQFNGARVYLLLLDIDTGFFR